MKLNFNFIFNFAVPGEFEVLGGWRTFLTSFFALGLIVACTSRARAQENYFVTYTHHMEEPGNLEISNKSVTGFPQQGSSFLGNATELEYGVKTWWTTEFYVDTQTTFGESTLFTGWRLENRFRPLLAEHWINPVLYFEFEDINGADKSLLEVVGHDGVADFLERSDRSEKEREAELRLILSSNFKGWNIAENMIAEKNLAAEPWEFGYALAASRPLSLLASGNNCRFCRENFSLGAELYGGLGDRYTFGFSHTSHYLAPTAAFHLPSGPTFTLSPALGLNHNSHGMLLRFGVSYEIDQIASRLRRKP